MQAIKKSNPVNIFKQGIEYLNLSNPSKALNCFSRVYREAGNVPDLHYARAVAFLQLGKPLQARVAFEEELAGTPDHNAAREFLNKIVSLENENNIPLAWPENTYLVNHNHRFIYCPIPKVVCSNLKKAVLKLTGFDKVHRHYSSGNNNGCNVHGDIHTCAIRECTFKVNKSTALHFLEDDSYFKFLFVRNPWSRLVSAYLDKFVKNYEEAAVDFNELIRRIQLRNNLDLDLNRRFTFRQFAEDIAVSDDMQLNPHWRPQSCFTGYHNFNFVGKFENLQKDLRYINQKLGIKLDLGCGTNSVGYARDVHFDKHNYFSDCCCNELKEIKKQNGGYPDYRQFYPPELKELIAERYRDDVEMFGYDFD